MSSEGLIVQTGEESFTGGNAVTDFLTTQGKGLAVGLLIAFLIMLLFTVVLPAAGAYYVPPSWCGLVETAEGSGIWVKKKEEKEEEDFGNCTREFCSPTGSPPDRALQEGSQPGSGGYGRQWDSATGKIGRAHV